VNVERLVVDPDRVGQPAGHLADLLPVPRQVGDPGGDEGDQLLVVERAVGTSAAPGSSNTMTLPTCMTVVGSSRYSSEASRELSRSDTRTSLQTGAFLTMATSVTPVAAKKELGVCVALPPAAVVAAARPDLAGCSGSSPTPAATDADTSSPRPRRPRHAPRRRTTRRRHNADRGGRTIASPVKGRGTPPRPGGPAAGETLTLTVTSDHDDELHAHGFEVEVPVKAGVPTQVNLAAKDPGVFEVELHEPRADAAHRGRAVR
jgi:hypothetical protein